MKHKRVNFRGILPARLKNSVVTKDNLDFKRGNYAEAIIERALWSGKLPVARMLVFIYESDVPSYGFTITGFNKGFANTMFLAIKDQVTRVPFGYAYQMGESGGHMFQIWSRNQDDHPKIRKFLMSMVKVFDTIQYP